MTASKARLRKRSVVVGQARIGSLRLLSKMLKTLAAQTARADTIVRITINSPFSLRLFSTPYCNISS